MNTKKNQAPSTHGSDAITEGAQSNDNKGASWQKQPSSGESDAEAWIEQKFSADLWREQVLSDPTLLSSQKLILFVLSTAFDERGYCETTHDWLAERAATGVRLIREYTPMLEELGWYIRKRKRYSMEYIAVRGREPR